VLYLVLAGMLFRHEVLLVTVRVGQKFNRH